MIKVEHLVKRYGTNYALGDISFEIGDGEIVGLLGPNGAGKSTTMNILTGYLSSTSGSAYINGINILEEPAKAKRFIGFLPEQPPLYQDMTVREYLNFVYDLKGVAAAEKAAERAAAEDGAESGKTPAGKSPIGKSAAKGTSTGDAGEKKMSARAKRDAHITGIMDKVKITDVADRLIKHLSKGYRQRVGIAQALVGDPKVVIFDEPTVGLDPKQILEVRNLLRSLSKDRTVILSTHILAEVQAVCERVIIINHGKIIADELTENITRTIEEGYRYKAKICGPSREVEAAIGRLSGVKQVTSSRERDGDAWSYRIECERGADVRKPLFSLCAKNDWAIIGLESSGGDLESVFIRLVDRSDGIPDDVAKRARRRAH